MYKIEFGKPALKLIWQTFQSYELVTKMLTLGRWEKLILDSLLGKEPKRVANDLGVSVQRVYSTKNYFLRKVQNGEEFVGMAHSKYKGLMKRRLKTPRIMPEEPEEDGEYHDEDFPETGLIPLKPRKNHSKLNHQKEDFKS